MILSLLRNLATMTDKLKAFIIDNLTPYQICSFMLRFELSELIPVATVKADVFKEIAAKYQITYQRARKIYYCEIKKTNKFRESPIVKSVVTAKTLIELEENNKRIKGL